MSPLLRGGLFVSALVLVTACVDLGQATTPPSPRLSTPATTTQPTAPGPVSPTAAPETAAPTVGATGGPSASLDPTVSDAGVAGRVTLANDVHGGRDGTYDIYGVAANGSECSGAFEEPNYHVVLWYDDAPDGQIRRLGVSVGAEDIPDADGSTTDITDGGVSFDFASPTGVGTQYSGNATLENTGSATIDVTRAGSTLTFDFEGETFAGAVFSGQIICADV